MMTMTAKLKPEIKAEWLAALRSGEYKQCDAALKKIRAVAVVNDGGEEITNNEATYCCLGVLCDLHAKKGLGTWQNRQDGYKPIDALFVTDYVTNPNDDCWPVACKSFTTLPNPVCDWAGVGASLETNPGALITIAALKTFLPKLPKRYLGMKDEVNVFIPLTELNDFGASFERIADFIEKYL